MSLINVSEFYSSDKPQDVDITDFDAAACITDSKLQYLAVLEVATNSSFKLCKQVEQAKWSMFN